ncbi:MAG TPA: hypothetical protein VHF22_13585 [Planctomycetota bacterium]|nr:hypothetical protein [Planctomycetota bacterium]
MRSSTTSILAIALLGLTGAPALASDAKDATKDEAASGLWGAGRLDLRYVFRTAYGDSTDKRLFDQDLTQDLFVEGGKESWLRFEASGRLHEDIDGRPKVSLFRDIYDTYGEPVHGYLYTAFGEVLDQGLLERARAGRQYYGNGVEVRFDGGLVETKPLGDALALTAYGGVPAHLYESSPHEDWLVGGAAELTAIPRTKVRADYVHVEDYRHDLADAMARDGYYRQSRLRDDYYQLAVTHQLLEEVRVAGTASTFGGSSSRLTGEVFLREATYDVSSRLRYTFQAGAYRDLSIDFSPLADVLGEYEPYHELYVDLRKGFLENFTVGGGFAMRELQSDSDEGPFNHEFRRYFGLAEAHDWPWDGLLVALNADYYRSDVADRTLQLSVDVSQKLGDFVVAGGSGYSLFKFDEFFLEERERVRSTFARIEWNPAKWIRPRVTYTYEDDDKETYHVLRCDLRISF